MILKIKNYKNTITLISGILIILAFTLGIVGYGVIKSILLITATIIASIPILIKALEALQMKTFSIELLVTIAVLGALYIREYTESSVVTFLFLFGAYLEARTLEKTRSSLKKLMDMAPQEATVIRNGEHITVPIEDVKKGETVIIRSGNKVPVDGLIISGKAYLNEATITGEAMPVSKKEGENVFSGTMVDNGYIEIIAEKVGDDTTFARLIELVEEAQEAKSKTARFLDKFANVYTPSIIAISIISYIITKNLHLSITFLVVACPGALVIGAPVSNVAGIGNGAKNGVLLKGGEVIDRLSKVDTLVFDKTGTLTKGRPEVIDIKTFFNQDIDELIKLTALAEKSSEHHLGRAIVKEAKSRNLNIKGDVRDFEVIKGNGISAKVEGHDLVIGNRSLMNNKEIYIKSEVSNYVMESEREGNTTVFVAKNSNVIGIFSIADKIREDALKALSEMRKNGIRKIIMLTGDNNYTAEIVAKKLKLDEFYAELLPENKVEYVQKIKNRGHNVAMAGDGINDAPAIATADIGLAMGDRGTDISMETADVVLMADKLMQFSHAYALSKATMRNMKQNIFFAVAIVFILLFGVFFGFIHLASGMFIHEASVLIVILNAMRLINYKPNNQKDSKDNL